MVRCMGPGEAGRERERGDNEWLDKVGKVIVEGPVF